MMLVPGTGTSVTKFHGALCTFRHHWILQEYATASAIFDIPGIHKCSPNSVGWSVWRRLGTINSKFESKRTAATTAC